MAPRCPLAVRGNRLSPTGRAIKRDLAFTSRKPCRYSATHSGAERTLVLGRISKDLAGFLLHAPTMTHCPPPHESFGRDRPPQALAAAAGDATAELERPMALGAELVAPRPQP